MELILILQQMKNSVKLLLPRLEDGIKMIKRAS
nr:MAG TPA: 11S regulator activator [Caudoviricetes sp.]